VKRSFIFTLFSLILLLASPAYSGGVAMMAGASGGAAAALTCQPYITITAGTASTGQGLGYDSNSFQAGQGLFLPASGTVKVCRVDVYPVKAGDPSTIEYYAQVWQHNATPTTALDSLVTNGTTPSHTHYVADATAMSFTWTSPNFPEMTAGTYYAILIRRCDAAACSDTTTDSTNYISLQRILATSVAGYQMNWKSNKAFYLGSTSYENRMVIYTMQ